MATIRAPPRAPAGATAKRTRRAPSEPWRASRSTASRSPFHSPPPIGYRRTAPAARPPARPMACNVATSRSRSSWSSPSNIACSSTNTARRTAKCAARSRAPRHSPTAASGGATTGELTPALLLEDPLPRGQARTGLTAGAARARVGVIEARVGQHRRHRAVDRGDVVGIRRRLAGHERPRHGPQRHDEGIDAHLDRPPAAVLGERAVLAHAEDHVGAHAAAAEDLHRALPRAEVALHAALGLARRDAREHV